MPTEKRERQRAGREARRAAALAAMRQRQRRRQVITLLVLVAVIFGIGFLVSRGGDDATDVTAGSEAGSESTEDCPKPDEDVKRKTEFTEPPELALEEGKDYTAEVCTDVGTFTIDLFEEKAPKTVNNFVFLARNRFYEGVPFHRVIKGFMAQGGDGENKDGTGGPGYTIEDELPEAGEYEIGSVAMANTSQPNTGGSQFFVITGQQGVQLPPNYSLFGKVTEGMDVVRKIEADGSEGEGKPAAEHRMVVVEIKTKDKKDEG